MEVNKVIHGSCLDVIKTFPDKSVNCVITSPPYWQLRDYKWDGQWGLEPTYQMYLENLWSLMDEIWRVLKDDGTVWFNLGDTYGGSNGFGTEQTKWKNADTFNNNKKAGSGKAGTASKCLLLIPHRFAIGCIERGWIMRNDVKWIKRNGMPESVTDRLSKKSEYFFFMTKKEKYYFDLDAIKDKVKTTSIERAMRGVSATNKWVEGADGQTPHNLSQPRPNITNKIPKEQAVMFRDSRLIQHKVSNGKSVFGGKKGDGQDTDGIYSGKEWYPNEGKNPGDVALFWDNADEDNLELDYWDVPTQGSNDEHFASYNTKLIDKPIMAGCPKGGIILDPFCGTATTGCRAIDLGRKFIGIEGSADYVKIANRKLHPYQITQQLF